MGNTDRTEPLTMIGPKGLERVVNALRVIAPELPFPIEFIELTDPKEEITIAGYRIQAYRVNHNIVCYGYSPVSYTHLDVYKRQSVYSASKLAAEEFPNFDVGQRRDVYKRQVTSILAPPFVY